VSGSVLEDRGWKTEDGVFALESRPASVSH
jgi:hypothetical protein